MRKALLAVVSILATFSLQAQVLLSESFDVTGFPNTGWTVTGSGTHTTPTNSVLWQRKTNGGFGGLNSPQPNTHSGTGMAGYESYWILSGGISDLVTPVMNFSATGNKILSFWVYQQGTSQTDSLIVYVNTSASATGATLVGAYAPNNVSPSGWSQKTITLPAAFNGTSNYVIFRAKSGLGEDIFIDDVSVENWAPCTGTPTAGSATASANPVCANRPFQLIATGYSIGYNIVYNWQSSPAGANTWTNIPGATTPNYTVAAGISAATDYRFYDSCTTSNNAAVSNVLTVSLNSYLNCYCTPVYTVGCTSTGTDDINTITLTGSGGTGISQVNAGCPSASVNGYTNYTSLTPVKMIQGSTYSGTMNTSIITSEYVRIWIDFNNDGVFAGSEQVSAFGALALKPSTTSYNVVIPVAANTGLHRMRVRMVAGVTPASNIDPCQSYANGETRDYMVDIMSVVPPAPGISYNGPVCPGSNIVITVASSYPNPSYTLTGPGYANNNTTGTFTITNATPAKAGMYKATVTSGGFTSYPDSLNVVVYNSPTAITAGNIVAPTTCIGANGSFDVCGLNPSTQYTLYYRKNTVGVTPFTITSNASGCYTVSGLGVGSYDSMQVTTLAPSNCKSNAVTIALIVPAPTPPPTPKPAYNNPVCPGSTLQLSVSNVSGAVPGSVYHWTGPAGFNTSATPTSTGNASRANMTAAYNGVYTVTVTTPTGCSSQDTITVTMRNPDPAPIPSNITYCQYDIALPLVAAGASGATLNWYDTGGTVLLPAAPTPNTTYATPFPTNIIYWVSQTLVCESPKAPLYVIITPKPLPPFIQDSTIDYCQFEIVGPLTASGQNIRWFSTPTGGTGSSTAPTPGTLVPGTFFFYTSQTVSGCESDRRTIRVIVKPKPEPPKVNSPLTLCQGDPMTPLTAIGKDLLWYTIPAGGIGVPVAPIINTGYEDSFTYYVTQTVNGCESDRALISAYVRYKPNGIITSNSQWVCQDAIDTFFYYGNARSDAEYVWFAPLSAHFVSGQGTPGPVIIHFDTAGTSVVQLIINNKGCISRLVAAPITVRPLPKFTFVNRQDVCEDELLNVALNATEPNISGYKWDFGSNDYVLEYGVETTGGPFGIRYPTPGQYIISVTATKYGCTSKPNNQVVYVHPRPDAHISVASGENPNDFCASDTLNLTVQAVPEGASYRWSPAAYFQSHKDTLNNQVRAVISQTSWVKVNVRTSYGCEADDSLLVKTKSCCGVYFPNAFSPDSRIEKNRTFKPITQGIHRINSFRVMNRWGQVVYESRVERAGWDGTYNGKPQDMGTYFYYISYKCEGKDVEEQGEVILMR